MKKSVVIIIAIIYIASIALVSFFGLQYKSFKETVYTTDIKITNADIKIDPDTGEKYVVIRPDAEGKRKYQILYDVSPDNATDKGVVFSYDEQNTSVEIDEYGVVTFSKKGAVIVEVVAKDGSGAKDTIKIMAR